MKKTSKITALAIIITIIILLFPSCNNGNIAGGISGLSDEEIARLTAEKTEEFYAESIKQEGTVSQTVSGKINGSSVKTEINASLLNVIIDKSKESLQITNVQDIIGVYKTEDDEHKEEYKLTSGFADGMMFCGYESSEKNVLRKSKLSYKNYIPFLIETEQLIEDPKFHELCEGVTVELSEDGSNYTLKYELSPENEKLTEYARRLTESFGVDFALIRFDYECVADAKTCIISSTKLYIESAYKKGSDDLTSVYTSEASLSLPEAGYNVTPENYKDYDGTYDLRYAAYFSKQLNELALSDNIGFSLSTHKWAKRSLTTVFRNIDKSDLIYGIKDGTYVHQIKSDVAEETGYNRYTITFDGENQSVTQETSGAKAEAPLSEIAARAYITSMLGDLIMAPYEADTVKINSVKDNITNIEITIDLEGSYPGILAELGFTSDGKKGFITITADFDADNRVIKAKAETYIELTQDGKDYIVTVNRYLSDIEDADLSGIEAKAASNGL